MNYDVANMPVSPLWSQETEKTRSHFLCAPSQSLSFFSSRKGATVLTEDCTDYLVCMCFNLNGVVWYVFFCASLLLLNFVRFTHVLACSNSPSFSCHVVPWCECGVPPFYCDRDLGHSWFYANNSPINIFVHVLWCLYTCISVIYILSNGISGLYNVHDRLPNNWTHIHPTFKNNPWRSMGGRGWIMGDFKIFIGCSP